MCTTASVQASMALLCGQIDPRGCEGEGRAVSHVVRCLDQCMNVGSVVHRRVERLLNERAQHGPTQFCHRMLGVNELLSILNINLLALHVK